MEFMKRLLKNRVWFDNQIRKQLLSRRKFHLIVLLFFVFAISLYSLPDRVVFLIGEWSPFCSEDMESNGMLCEIVTAAYSEVGIETEFLWMTWIGAIENSKFSSKYAGSFGWYKEPYKQEYFFYSDQGLYKNMHAFFHRKDFDFKWNDVNDLKGLTIGHTRGYSYLKVMREALKNEGISIEIAEDDSTNLKKLYGKRIDLFDCDVLVADKLLGSCFSKDDRKKIVYNPKLITNEYVYLLISKKFPDAEYLIAKFNEGYRKIIENGEYQKIVDKYRIQES